MSDRLFTFFMPLLFAGISGIFLNLSGFGSWFYWLPDGLFRFFILLLFAAYFLGLPGLISWFCLSLQGRIVRRMGRRNTSKIVRTIEFVCIFASSFAVLHHVWMSQNMT
jgi:hypothetical protein